MSAQNKRSSMTLYVNDNDPLCHLIKIVLAEKDIVAELINVEKDNKLEELYELNHYGTVPTLMTKDIIIYETDIIFEYLEERFPYPPLLSVFPVERAQTRMLWKKIHLEWMPLLLTALNSTDEAERQENKLKLLKVLFGLLSTLSKQPYLLSDEFTITDCSMAVILYNLPKLGVRLPEKAAPLIEYAKRLFQRKSFQESIQPS